MERQAWSISIQEELEEIYVTGANLTSDSFKRKCQFYSINKGLLTHYLFVAVSVLAT